jgi:hypothetical protein
MYSFYGNFLLRQAVREYKVKAEVKVKEKNNLLEILLYQGSSFLLNLNLNLNLSSRTACFIYRIPVFPKNYG